MSNHKKRAPKKRRGAKIGLAVCMVAAVAVTGVYTFQQYRSNVKNELAKIEEESQKEMEEYESAGAEEIIQEEPEENHLSEETEDSGDIDFSEEAPEADAVEESEELPEETEYPAESQETGSGGSGINFSEGDKLIWPVSGAVLMNYSMDKTVYFATLEQYKYNPALIIGGAVNDQVISSGKGIVKSIDRTPQEGTTVSVDMGNGYEAIYGQLQNVQVKTGDSVEAKTVLGYLAEPTRYYSVEGCNLYFEFRKDGQPIDPLQYLSE